MLARNAQHQATNPPAEAERHILSDFLKDHAEPSKLLPGRMCAARRIFSCPSCGDEADEPQHGVGGRCQTCLLRWVSYGNMLYIWRV
jgi:hypothetical protein